MTNVYTIITGGLGGLGSAFALECARLGRHLFLIDQHSNANELVTYLQSQFPIDVLYQQCDLADQDDRLDLILGWKSQKMVFDGLINIVGTEVEGKSLNRTREEVIRMVHLNNAAMVDLTLAALNQRSLDPRFWQCHCSLSSRCADQCRSNAQDLSAGLLGENYSTGPR